LKILIPLLLSLPAIASAEETLLICEGESVQWWDDEEPHNSTLKDEITLVINGNYVETNGHRVEFSYKDGTTWVWGFEWKFITGDVSKWLFNLNTVSGALKKIAYPTTGDTNRVQSIAEYRCRKVDRRIVE
jgi:hypothetical protein